MIKSSARTIARAIRHVTVSPEGVLAAARLAGLHTYGYLICLPDNLESVLTVEFARSAEQESKAIEAMRQRRQARSGQ